MPCFFTFGLLKKGACAPWYNAKAQCHLFNNNYCFCLHVVIYTTYYIKNQAVSWYLYMPNFMCVFLYKKHRHLPVFLNFFNGYFYKPLGVAIFTDETFLFNARMISSVISNPAMFAPVRAIRPSITIDKFFLAIVPSIIGSR